MSNKNTSSYHFFWLEEARLFPEVIQNPGLEETFKSFGEKIYDEGFKDGYDDGRIEGNEESDESSYQNGYTDGQKNAEKIYEENKNKD